MKHYAQCLLVLTTAMLLLITVAQAGWLQTNGPHAPAVNSMVVKGPDVYAATNMGVFRSSDSGNSWTFVSAGPTIEHDGVRCLVADNAGLYGGTRYNGVFRSTDDGATWIRTGLATGQVFTLMVTGSSVYAGTNEGAFRSDDEGVTWVSLNEGLTNLHGRCFIQKGSYLFVGTDDGVFRSSDNGTTWTRASSGLANLYMCGFATAGDYLFASTWNDCVYRSLDDGATWIKCGNGLSSIRQIICYAVDGGNIYGGSVNGGVYFSSNNGDSWTQKNSGLTGRYVSSIALFGSRMLVGTSGRGVSVSDDAGLS